MNESERRTLTEAASDILTLRVCVLALGEISKPPWWRTKLLSDVGLRFLERLYPRTGFSAAVYSASKAACEIHDQSIGRRSVYHLFRLPINIEREIKLAMQLSDDIAKNFYQAIEKPDLLKSKLATRAASADRIGGTGPRRVGTANDVFRKECFGIMAAVYLDAYSKGYNVYPYFEIAEGSL